MTPPTDGIPPIGDLDRHLAAHLFNSDRLTLAREFCGYTQKQLAESVNKTSSAISQFEKGKAKPDHITLRQIALALGFPVSFFAQPTRSARLEPQICHFRSLRSTTETDKRRILAHGSLLCELFEYIENYIELPEEQVSALKMNVDSAEEIEACAEEVRSAWNLGLGPIPDITRLLESKGVIISFVAGHSKKMDAFSAWLGSRPYIFLSTEKDSCTRLRFNAAHELGHLIMHQDAEPGDKTHESQAHRFGSAFLVPRKPFLAECPRWLNWDHFYELKRRWKVSVAALIRRAYDLDCITAASYERACIHLNKTGEKLKEKHEPPMEKPALLEHALLALAEEDIQAPKLALMLGWSQDKLEKVKDTTKLAI